MEDCPSILVLILSALLELPTGGEVRRGVRGRGVAGERVPRRGENPRQAYVACSIFFVDEVFRMYLIMSG